VGVVAGSDGSGVGSSSVACSWNVGKGVFSAIALSIVAQQIFSSPG